MHYLSQIVFRKVWFAVFNVKITVKIYIVKITLCNLSCELLILWQLNLVCWYIIISCVVL